MGSLILQVQNFLEHTSFEVKFMIKGFNIGAEIITYTIGAPYYQYSIMDPKSYSNY